MSDLNYNREAMRKAIQAPAPDHAAILMAASHYQGGHSDIGAMIADMYGIPFPLTMDTLSRAARKRKLDPDVLWPWLKPMQDAWTAANPQASACALEGE